MIHRLQGHIASVGFGSGWRFVVGHWTVGPIGAMNDVMAVSPDGQRTLFAPDQRVADFVSAIYRFDSVQLAPISVHRTQSSFVVVAGSLQLQLQSGRAIPIPGGRWRPLWMTRYVENPIAKRLMGVQTYGVTATGIQEWYSAWSYRPIRTASATLDGRDLGSMLGRVPKVEVGFSEPPPRPSLVEISPALFDPSGKLDWLIDHG